jgi:hypothetical protein
VAFSLRGFVEVWRGAVSVEGRKLVHYSCILVFRAGLGKDGYELVLECVRTVSLLRASMNCFALLCFVLFCFPCLLPLLKGEEDQVFITTPPLPHPHPLIPLSSHLPQPQAPKPPSSPRSAGARNYPRAVYVCIHALK